MQNGSYYVSHDNIIYVQATINKRRIKRSTGKKATPINLKWIKRNYRDVLQNFIAKEKKPPNINIGLKEFGYQVLELGSHKRDETVQRDYIAAFENHILSYFKNYDINQIKSIDIEIWQKYLLTKMSSRTADRCRMILNMIIKKAYANDLTDKNYGDLAEKIYVEYKKQEPYTVVEMEKMLKLSEGMLKIYLHIAFFTGMRVGELLALKFTDIDYERSIVKLKRSLSKGKIKEAKFTSGGKIIKNHCRTVIIPKFLSKMVSEWRTVSPSDQWLFVSKRTKRPFYESRTVANYLKIFLNKIGVEYKTLKPTRHTFISILRSEGVDKNFIQDLVGHTQDSFVTDKHYTTLHVTQAKIDAVNNVFKNMRFCP